jgi:hypothetical protein
MQGQHVQTLHGRRGQDPTALQALHACRCVQELTALEALPGPGSQQREAIEKDVALREAVELVVDEL